MVKISVLGRVGKYLGDVAEAVDLDPLGELEARLKRLEARFDELSGTPDMDAIRHAPIRSA